MTDTSVAKRAIFVAAGSVLALAAASPSAFADGEARFDSDHINLNNGTSCAAKDAGNIAKTVLTDGKLPSGFNNVRPGGGPVDGVSELCHAVDSPPPGHRADGVFALTRRPKMLLGGLPVHRH